MIETDISNIWGSIDFSKLMSMEERLREAHASLADGTGAGLAGLGAGDQHEVVVQAAVLRGVRH